MTFYTLVNIGAILLFIVMAVLYIVAALTIRKIRKTAVQEPTHNNILHPLHSLEEADMFNSLVNAFEEEKKRILTPNADGIAPLQLVDTNDLIMELKNRSSSLMLLRVGRGAINFDKDLSAIIQCNKYEIPALWEASQELLARVATQFDEREDHDDPRFEG